jgi:hypothetical protein
MPSIDSRLEWDDDELTRARRRRDVGLGHEPVETTPMYLHADLALKERALARTTPLDSKPGRYRPDRRTPRVPGWTVTRPNTQVIAYPISPALYADLLGSRYDSTRSAP